MYPLTMNELKIWAEENNLSLEQMNTYIDEDYKGARAFGIYRDQMTGNYVVYKNKDDGTRAIRYKGKDEAYAVRELYMKLQERIDGKKNDSQARYAPGQGASPKMYGYNSAYQQPQTEEPDFMNRFKKRFFVRIVVIAVVMIVTMVYARYFMIKGMHGVMDAYGNRYDYDDCYDSGYYLYDDTYYYCQDDDFYYFDFSDDEWYQLTNIDDELLNHYHDYYQALEYYDYYGVDDFCDSQYFDLDYYNDCLDYYNDYGYDDWDDYGYDDWDDYDYDDYDYGGWDDYDWGSDW